MQFYLLACVHDSLPSANGGSGEQNESVSKPGKSVLFEEEVWI